MADFPHTFLAPLQRTGCLVLVVVSITFGIIEETPAFAKCQAIMNSNESCCKESSIPNNPNDPEPNCSDGTTMQVKLRDPIQNPTSNFSGCLNGKVYQCVPKNTLDSIKMTGINANDCKPISLDGPSLNENHFCCASNANIEAQPNCPGEHTLVHMGSCLTENHTSGNTFQCLHKSQIGDIYSASTNKGAGAYTGGSSAGGVGIASNLMPPPPATPPGPGGIPPGGASGGGVPVAPVAPVAIAPGGAAPATAAAAPNPGPPPLERQRGNISDSGGSGDHCSYSDKINHEYGCDTTYNVVQSANMTNMMTQMTGSMATQMMGQHSQMQAMSAGTQSAALEAAATTQKQTGEMQVGIGGMNAALGIYQLVKGSQHKSNAQKIETGANSGGMDAEKFDVAKGNASSKDEEFTTRTKQANNTAGWVEGKNEVQKDIINSYTLNKETGITMHGVDTTLQASNKAVYDRQVEQRTLDGKAQQTAVSDRAREIGNTAAREQRSIASQAMAGGMMSLMTGTQQLMNGGMGIMSANELEKAAKALQNTNNNYLPSNVQLPQTPDLANGAQTAMGSNAITGSGAQDGAPATSDTPTPSDAPPSLGGAFNPLPMNSGVPDGPGAGKFNVGNPQSGGGGGGGGVPDGGNTNANSGATTEDPQAKLAPNDKEMRYESGGTFSGGGRGGNGKGADGGPDLSNLLEKFLPKEKEANTPGNSILQFGNAGGPGYDQPLSVLDKNANIFQRIHETYQDKHRHGNI